MYVICKEISNEIRKKKGFHIAIRLIRDTSDHDKLINNLTNFKVKLLDGVVRSQNEQQYYMYYGCFIN